MGVGDITSNFRRYVKRLEERAAIQVITSIDRGVVANVERIQCESVVSETGMTAAAAHSGNQY